MNEIERTVREQTDAYRARMGLPPLRPRYHRARCGPLIRDTGADDLRRHEESCAACIGGWSIHDRPESEERYLDDPRHGQAAYLKS